jgi:tRNA(Ile)-lysidine synthase
VFSLDELKSRIQNGRGGMPLLPPSAAVCVAFSGGLDSTVLLHVFTRLASYQVRALHVDHGLHTDSAAWREHCQQQAQALQIEFTSVRVEVLGASELGTEAAAPNICAMANIC